MSSSFIPVSAPVHRRRLSRLETAFIARRNVLEIIPAYAYRQPIVSGDMLVRWHMLADPAGLKRVMLDNLANYPKSEIMRRMLRPGHRRKPVQRRRRRLEMAAPGGGAGLHPSQCGGAGAGDERHRRRAPRRGWRHAADARRLVAEMLTATFDVICDVALSGREHFDSETFSKAITQYFQTAGRASLLDFLGFPGMVSPPRRIAGGIVGPHHAFHGGGRPSKRAASRPTGLADDLLDHMLAAQIRKPGSA